MGSSGKRKTTMAKLNRERKLQERRRDKAARKDARRSSPEPALWGSAALSADPEEAGDLGDRTTEPEDRDAQDQPGPSAGVGEREPA